MNGAKGGIRSPVWRLASLDQGQGHREEAKEADLKCILDIDSGGASSHCYAGQNLRVATRFCLSNGHTEMPFRKWGSLEWWRERWGKSRVPL